MDGWDLILTIVAPLSTIIIGIMPNRNIIYNRRIKKYTSAGKWFIGFAIIAVISVFAQSVKSYVKSIQTEKTDSIARSDLKKQITDLKNGYSEKIASTRKVLADSITIGSNRTIDKLQETINKQTKALDSINRHHAEKHLTQHDKKDILAKIITIEKERKIGYKDVGISMTGNSNGSAFSIELIEFLKKKGYNPGSRMSSPPSDLQGYRVDFFMGRPVISIGAFDLN